MFLLAGLGNPGARYAGNRHNVGFMAVDAIAAAHGFGPFAPKFGGMLCEGRFNGTRTLLFKPMGYMNLSGEAIGELARFYKLTLEHICVIHDELDVVLGRVRLKRGGSAGGHNGLKSIDAHIGEDYLRVRIGINHPGHKDLVSGYVLSDFTGEETRQLKPVIAAIVKHAPLLAAGDEKAFSNQLALTLNPPIHKPAPSSPADQA